jgi:hypothetical protein
MSHQVFRGITKGYDQWALPVFDRACPGYERLGICRGSGLYGDAPLTERAGGNSSIRLQRIAKFARMWPVEVLRKDLSPILLTSSGPRKALLPFC